MKSAGIINYGTAIPRYRLKVADIARAWGKNPDDIMGSLGVREKSVSGTDEDSVTLAVEAGFSALSDSGLSRTEIEAVFVGSESHPYAVNPTATIVGDLLGIGTNYLATDLEFACKAGTVGMQLLAGLIGSKQIKYGLAIGVDTAQSKTHDSLEYASSSGSAAYLMGSGSVAAELLDYVSFSSDAPDFWRRDGISYPSHAGRFTGEPAYFAHVTGAAKLLMDKTKIVPEKITNCVFHMPNAKFPKAAAKRLGFTPEQLKPSLVVGEIGNPYSASSLLGLAATLDQAKPGDLIFMVSFGSGAGSDAFLWKVNKEIIFVQEARKKNKLRVQDQIKNKFYIDYTRYLRQTHKI